MLFFLTGVPGSGKTYFLVKYSEDNISKVDVKTGEKQYLQVVHNISGYKHGFYVDFGEDYLPKILDLFDYFKSIKKENNKDDLLIDYAESIGLYKILLIVDEAHLYFVNDFTEKGKKQYYALLWFISYHRHLYIDIVLSTQNLSLVDYKFKSFAEYFIKSVPSSLRFKINPFSKMKFTYNYFPDSKMWRDTKYKTDHIVADNKIFSLYTSGDSVKKQNVFLPTLLIIFGLIAALVFLWFLFKYSFTHNSSSVDSNNQTPNLEVNTSSVYKKSNPKSSLNPKQLYLSDQKSKEFNRFSNEDVVFDIVTCSTVSGTCHSTFTTNAIDLFFFNKFVSLELVDVFSTFTQYGITKYYISLNMSKSSYLSKFLIVPDFYKDENYESFENKDLNIDYEKIKDDFVSF